MSINWWHRLDAPINSPVNSAHVHASRILKRLRDLRIRIPGGSRFLHAESILRDVQDGAPAPLSDSVKMDRILEAVRDVTELYTGVFGSSESPSNPMRDRIETALGGAVLSSEETDHSARDAQFELYIYGLLSMSGLRVRWCEPDLAMLFGGEELAVAVKRLWNPDLAKKRLSIAAEQIAGSGMRGIIATSGQVYVSPLLSGIDPLVHRDAWRGDIARLRGHLPYLTVKPHVLALLVIAVSLKWEYNSTGIGIRGASYADIHTLRDDQIASALHNYWRGPGSDNASAWLREDRTSLATGDTSGTV